jgi:hypothetical protein
VDLLDFFRGDLTADGLLQYIDRLPAHGHFMAEVAQDDDLAADLLANGDLPEPGPPPLTDFSPEVRVMADIADRLAQVVQAIGAAAGASWPVTPPYPRPKTALDRAKANRSRQRHQRLMDFINQRRKKIRARRRAE